MAELTRGIPRNFVSLPKEFTDRTSKWIILTVAELPLRHERHTCLRREMLLISDALDSRQ